MSPRRRAHPKRGEMVSRTGGRSSELWQSGYRGQVPTRSLRQRPPYRTVLARFLPTMPSLADSLQVRPFRLDDASVVEPWLCGPGLSLPAGAARATWPQRLLADARITAQIAEAAGRQLGLVRLDIGPDRVAEITLVVAPEHRRTGLGGALFAAALATARRLGVRRLMAIVDVGNQPALAFFQEQGFAADGVVADRLRLWRLVHAGEHQRPLDIEV